MRHSEGEGARRGEAGIRVVAIEDDARYRASLEALLRHASPFHFVRAFASPEPVLRSRVLMRRPIIRRRPIPTASGSECVGAVGPAACDVAPPAGRIRR